MLKLVDDVRDTWKHWSTWALTTLAGLGGVWGTIPQDVKDSLPSIARQGVAWLIFVVALLGLGAKFVAQKNLEPPKDAS